MMNDIEIAKKYYERFCDEFLTALKNIKNIKEALAWKNIDNVKECNILWREAQCYNEILERAQKEVKLNIPQPDFLIEQEKYSEIKQNCDDFLDKIFPKEKYFGKREEEKKIFIKKGQISEYLSNAIMQAFLDGYETFVLENKK